MKILARQLTAIACAFLLTSGTATTAALTLPRLQTDDPSQDVAKIPDDQLDSLVAPVALYADPLLAQVLAASTYPLEIIQLQQWLTKHKDLKGQALVDAAEKQDWDPSVQALAPLPDVAKRLADEIQWTTDLGNAFLAQQSDVMDAVQRMRAKAKNAGNLKSTEQQRVETQVIDNKSVVVIQPSDPQVIYIPSYNPAVVYGPPVYPYPPIYYPPPGSYAAGVAISFGVGLAIGAAWSGGWGWGCGWGGSNNNNIVINNNNNFVRNSNTQNNINNVNRNRAGGSNNWQHNPQHRGAAPYSNQATANRFGGTTQGNSVASRQAQARPNQGQLSSGQGTGANGLAARSSSGVGGGGSNPGANRGAGAGGNGGGGDRIGNRSVPSNSSAGSKGGSAFGGASSGMSGSSARASGQRGASSMGGGGARGGGGGRRR